MTKIKQLSYELANFEMNYYDKLSSIEKKELMYITLIKYNSTKSISQLEKEIRSWLKYNKIK